MKYFTKLCFILSVLFIFAACAKDDTTTSTNGESINSKQDNSITTEESTNPEGVELKIWLAGSGDTQSDQTYRAILDGWIKENSPNSTYELTFVPWTEYFSKISTALVSGEGPDLFMSGFGQIGTLYNQDSILDVTQYIPSEWDGYTDIPQNLLDVGSVDGHIYGLLEPSTRVFFYRKDIAEANGVTEADLQVKNLDDLKKLVEKMCVYDGDNLLVAGLDVMTAATGSGSPEQYFYFTSANIDKDIKLWGSDYKATFNNETGIEAMNYLKGLYDAGYCFQSDPSDITAGIVSGLSAMTLTSEAVYATADAAFPGNIGIVPADLNSILIGNFIVVNKTTEHPTEATDLLTYMFSTEACKTKAEGLGQYTLRTSLDDWYIETLPQMKNVVQYYKNSESFSDYLNPTYNQQITVFRQTYEKMMETDIAISQALTEAESEWNAIIQ